MRLCLAVPLCLVGSGLVAQDFPRIANLWGCGPSATNYDDWARYDLLVMAGGSPEQWRHFRAEMKARNPGILLLDTGPLMNLGAPGSTPWMLDEWYLCRPDGEKVIWWAGQIYTPNLLIDECLDALVDQTVKQSGELLADGTLDGMFYDSVVGRASWLGEVDTNRDGKADVPAEVDPEWLARQNLFFERLRERYPRMLILANDVDAGHRVQANGRLFEGAPLLDRVASGAASARQTARELTDWMTGALQPGITFAIMTHPLGWQGWRVGKGDKVTTPGEVDRARRNFRRMRLGLATTLMSDAYYAYDFGTVWYGLPWWFAEYDAPLGKPLGPAQEVQKVPPMPVLDWQAGKPTDALVLDAAAHETPEGIVGGTEIDGGWQRLFATDFRQVPLQPGKRYHIAAECTILERPTRALQFNVRTGEGGWEHHDKGIQHNAGEPGSRWSIDVTIIPDDFEDYAAEWHLLGAGTVRLESLRVELVGESYLMREFEGGAALLNDSPYPLEVELEKPWRRLKDEAAPRFAIEVDDDSPDFATEGAWELAGGEQRFSGPGYRRAGKPGDRARWTFAAPSTDRYTLFVAVPGGKTLTDAAMYAVEGESVTLNQRPGDGGWMKLLEVDLTAGQACTVSLTSGGTGATAADALRAESAARYNDGALVSRLDLAPYDGAVLIRE